MNTSANINRAVDARIDEWAMTKYNEVIAQFASEYFAKRSKELRQKDAELEARIAELERLIAKFNFKETVV